MRRQVVTLSVVALVAACGFPDVTYESPGGGDASHTDAPFTAEGSGGDASEAGDATSSGDSEASAGTDAAGDGGDASTSADTGTDAPLVDADATTDAPADSSAADTSFDAVEEQPADSGADAPADAPPVCDFDQDTYKAKGATCGGNDCCDTDNKAHPNQASFFTQADACGSFDYNCNGTNDPEYPANLACGGTGLTGCTGGSAFIAADPGCGNSGLYGTCVANGILACQPGNEMTVTQGCH
jgi:hypothetical protein